MSGSRHNRGLIRAEQLLPPPQKAMCWLCLEAVSVTLLSCDSTVWDNVRSRGILGRKEHTGKTHKGGV